MSLRHSEITYGCHHCTFRSFTVSGNYVHERARHYGFIIIHDLKIIFNKQCDLRSHYCQEKIFERYNKICLFF